MDIRFLHQYYIVGSLWHSIKVLLSSAASIPNIQGFLSYNESKEGHLLDALLFYVLF